VAESGIRGVALTSDKPVNGNRFTAWLNNVLQTQGPDILRAKGIIDVAGENRRLVFQAVHMILEGDYQAEWTPADKRYSRMVLIGRNLDEAKLREGFESTVA
jgi:G3E family GTPase